MNSKYVWFTVFTLLAKSHSWLECTNYTGDLEVFEPDQCQGRPRPLDANGRNVGGTFGQDIGMDFRPAASGANPCQGDSTLGLNQNYGGAGNVVQYEAGKTYTLAWPPKNHAAATCTNAFIPDNFLKIFAVPYDDGQADPNQADFRNMPIPSSFESDPHVQGVIDFKGFQNCPRFCDDTDKSLCTGTITIPNDMPQRTYTLQWYWAFNSPTDLYATCWEANIVANTGGDGDTTVTMPPASDPECTNCCVSGPIQAPGTGQVVTYPSIDPGNNVTLDCPDNYDGTFKVMCIEESAGVYIARLVDGQCAVALNSNDETDDQSGTVAGLSVALVLVILLFLFYVLITRGIIDCADDQDQKPKKLDNYTVGKDQSQTKTVNSSLVVRQSSSNDTLTLNEQPSVPEYEDDKSAKSNTNLPVLPDTPIKWYHTIPDSEETVGPIDQKDLLKYCKKLGVYKALNNVMVWNGEDITDWTTIKEVSRLKNMLE